MKDARQIKSAIMLLLLCIFVAAGAHADINLKIAVVNPSATEKQSTPIRYDLPKGIGPEQIIDIGKLEMKYDFDKGNYYLVGIVDLMPSERKVLEIALRDVWKIPEKDLSGLRSHTDLLVSRLIGTKHYEAGNKLAKGIIGRLDNIINTEKGAAGISVKERINQYYENAVVLTEIKEDMGMLENLVLDTGGIVEDRVSIPSTLAVPLKTDEALTDKDIIEINVKASNPSKWMKQVTSIKYSLPTEISPRYIVDSAGLDMAYDFNKECFYLYKTSLELAPGETKEHIVKVKDIWKISDVELDALRSHTNNIMLLLKGTEYLPQAKLFSDTITANIGEIVTSQAQDVPAQEHIANYRGNEKLLQEAKNKISELEKFVSQRGVTTGVTVKWPAEEGGGTLSKKAKGYEGLDMIAQSIFKGKAPTATTTWKVIFGIIGFIGIITVSFFTLWYVQSKKKADK